jgi:hypothetical protein
VYLRDFAILGHGEAQDLSTTAGAKKAPLPEERTGASGKKNGGSEGIQCMSEIENDCNLYYVCGEIFPPVPDHSTSSGEICPPVLMC